MRIATARLDGRIGYIAFNHFLDPATVMPVFNHAVSSFMDADGIIIDVRGNPGGQAEMIAGMAGWFIREKGRYLGIVEMRDALNTFDCLAYWRKSFKKVETSGFESVNGRSCYRVAATPHEAPPQTLLFDRETHLLSKLTMTMEIQAGTVPMASYLGNYKAVDGILIPHRVTIKVLSQERIGTVESVEQNVQLPAGRFDLPPAIAALVKKAQ